MKNYLAIAIGVIMMGVAFLLAINSTSQDDATRPEIARQLATRLHEIPTQTPTPTVTPTLTLTPLPSPTPVATVTLVAGWTKLSSRNIEMWLPPNYQLLESDERVTIRIYFSRADLVGDLKFLAYDSGPGMRSSRDVHVFQVKSHTSPLEVPYGIDIVGQIVETPRAVSLGRYTGYRAVADMLNRTQSHYIEVVYWIRHGEYYYVIIYTTPAQYSAQDVPIFDESIRTMTILSDD